MSDQIKNDDLKDDDVIDAEDGEIIDDNSGEVVTDPVIETKTSKGNNVIIKERVNRAKTQAKKNLLKDLGVNDEDEAKDLIATAKKALDEVAQLRAELESNAKNEEMNTKRSLLVKLLDNEKVFDSEALVNYIELDNVELVNGAIQDSDKIIESLKTAKPNFFAKFTLQGDTYVRGSNAPVKTALEKQQDGDNVGAIKDFLKDLK